MYILNTTSPVPKRKWIGPRLIKVYLYRYVFATLLPYSSKRWWPVHSCSTRSFFKHMIHVHVCKFYRMFLIPFLTRPPSSPARPNILVVWGGEEEGQLGKLLSWQFSFLNLTICPPPGQIRWCASLTVSLPWSIRHYMVPKPTCRNGAAFDSDTCIHHSH